MGNPDLDREWQRFQDSRAGQMELLQVRLNLLGEAILASLPPLPRRVRDWLAARLVR